MKFKIYLTNLALVLSIAIGLLTTTHTNAQDSDTRALLCNSCTDAQKQHQVQQLVDSGYPQGQYRFVVIDMEIGNVREYDVNVPYQDHGQFGQWSQPATVSVIYRADQALRNQRVKDVRDAVKNIEQTIDETIGISIPIPASSNYVSAYDALSNKEAFGRYVTRKLSEATTLSETVREGTLKVVLMTESLQVGMSAVATFSMTVNRAIHTWVTFDDGSKLQITLKLGHELGEGLQINVTTTVWGKDKDGNDIPLHDRELTSTDFGTAGINPTSLTRFFALLGVKIVYSHGSFGGGGGSCETKWKCSSDGKTCTLEVITASCS